MLTWQVLHPRQSHDVLADCAKYASQDLEPQVVEQAASEQHTAKHAEVSTCPNLVLCIAANGPNGSVPAYDSSLGHPSAACSPQVAEELEGSNLSVITRSGNPAKPSEQRRASVAAADTVVLMWPSGLSPADASAQQAAVLASLKTSGGVLGQKIVVQSAGQEVGEYDAVQVRPGSPCAAFPTAADNVNVSLPDYVFVLPTECNRSTFIAPWNMMDFL